MIAKTKRRKKRAAQAKRRKRTRRVFNPAARLWTLAECGAWSGVPYKTLLMLVKTGAIAAVAIGDEFTQTVKKTGKTRSRGCAKYMILSAPFIQWVEGLTPGAKLTVAKSAA